MLKKVAKWFYFLILKFLLIKIAVPTASIHGLRVKDFNQKIDKFLSGILKARENTISRKFVTNVHNAHL